MVNQQLAQILNHKNGNGQNWTMEV